MIYKDEITKLGEQCFKIEKTLPLEAEKWAEELRPGFRRMLLRVRYDILSLTRYAQLIDEENADNGFYKDNKKIT